MNTKMSKTGWLTGILLLGSVLTFSFLGLVSASGGSTFSEWGEHEKRRFKSSRTFKPDSLYNEECGACHLAYPPGLLPAESWEKLMSGLENHFDENAELDGESLAHIANYLEQHSLSRGQPSKMNKMLRNIPDIAPIRITELPYFIRKHDEIPESMAIKNPKVGSFSRCASCHKEAEKGVFNEDMVSIPGFGRWDD
jgi:hypothetical protein